jgi:formylglycine-generating enzyme required for sulfatase activity
MTPRHPPEFPPLWANGWGDDRFGLWVEFQIQDVVQRMRWIEPGEFLMGAPESEAERYSDEGPQHRVRLTQGFWLADSACTQALWLAVMGGENPSYFSDDPQCPVEQVSWDEVDTFLQRLREQMPASSAPMLPSEAQWEYACRAGTTTPFNLGENITPEQVNYDGNYPYNGAKEGEYRQRTVPVKSLPANAWGLYEMHGNVYEWCADGMRKYEALPAGEVLQARLGPTESASASASRALRGGSWINRARRVRSARRNARTRDDRFDDFGFRLALRSTSPVRPEGA